MGLPFKQRSSIIKLVKTIQHRQLDFAIRDIADLISCVETIDNRLNTFAFTDLSDTPADYSGAAGKMLAVNGTGDGIEFLPVPAGPDGNTWDMTAVAFVDAASGNDGTAVVGDGNKPYATVFAAQAASSLVFLKPANYTETVTLKTGTTYYCYAGVKFISGGLRAPATPLIDTQWLGHADFVGNFFQIYLLSANLTDVVIEFNRLVGTSTSCRTLLIQAAATSNVVVNGNYIDDFGANGHGPRFEGLISGTINIKDYIKCPYGTIFLGQFATKIDGDLTINCPRIITPNGGFVGNVAAFKQSVYVNGLAATGKVTINGDFYCSVNVVLGSSSGILSLWGNTDAGGTIIHNGKIYAGELRALHNITVGNMIHKGSIDSDDRAFRSAAGNMHIMSVIKQSNTSQIAGSGVVYIDKSSIYCDGNNLNIVDHLAAAGDLYITDTNAEGTGVAEFINTGGAANTSGMINVTSNFANDVALVSNYTASGFTQEANLNVPKFN